MLFRLSFFDFVFIRGFADARLRAGMDPGRAGESVPSRSESESSDEDSEKGKRPRASSIRDMPRDQTSDFTVYCAPCMRSG